MFRRFFSSANSFTTNYYVIWLCLVLVALALYTYRSITNVAMSPSKSAEQIRQNFNQIVSVNFRILYLLRETISISKRMAGQISNKLSNIHHLLTNDEEKYFDNKYTQRTKTVLYIFY